jgi:hypothetical protein
MATLGARKRSRTAKPRNSVTNFAMACESRVSIVYYAEVHAAEGGSEPAGSATAEPLAIVLGCGFINPQLQPHVKALSGKGKRTALVSMMSHAAAATRTGIGRLGCTIFRRGVWVGCRRLLRLQADRHDVRRRLPDLLTMKEELGHRIRSRRVSSGADVRKLARLRHADCVEQCPSSGQSGKHMLGLSSSQFDPTGH